MISSASSATERPPDKVPGYAPGRNALARLCKAPIKSVMVQNVGWLLLVQLAAYAAPLTTIPYLARVLGPAAWADYAFADSYGRTLIIFIECGFLMSGTRAIAQQRHNVAARSLACSGAMAIQLSVSLVLAVVTLGLTRLNVQFSHRSNYIWLALCWAVPQAVLPYWYFQGMEQIRAFASIDVVVKLLGTAAIFAFVTGPATGYRVFLVLALASATSLSVGLVLMVRATPLRRPTLSSMWSIARSGFVLFLCKGVATFFNSANPLLLAQLTTPVDVGFYAAAEKVCRSFINLLNPVNQAAFPRIASLMTTDTKAAARTARRVLGAMLVLAVVITIVMLTETRLIVSLLLGSRYTASIPVLRLLAVLTPVVAVSNLMGLQWLLALKLDGIYLCILILGAATNVALSRILVPLYGISGMAMSVICSELLVAAAVVAAAEISGKSPWRRHELPTPVLSKNQAD